MHPGALWLGIVLLRGDHPTKALPTTATASLEQDLLPVLGYSPRTPTSTFPRVEASSAVISALGGCLPSPAAFSLHLNRNVSFSKQFTFLIPEVSRLPKPPVFVSL